MKTLRLFLFLFLPIVVTSCGNTTDEQPVADTTPVKDSLTSINELIRKDPNNLDLYYRRALIMVDRKDYGIALLDINRILALDSNTTKYLLTGADIHFFIGKIQRADQLLRRAVQIAPEDAECALRLAQLHHYLKRYDEELELLNGVLDRDKRNSQAYFMKGMVCKEQNDTANAMKNMQLAVQMDPDYYNAYIQMGLIAANQKNPLAVDYYRNALEIQPTSQEALYDLGMYYQETDQYNPAIETYTALLKVNPHHFDAHFNLGMIHAYKLDVVDEGLKYFNMAIEDNPTEPRGYYGRGYCFEKKGDVNAATADYKKALEVDPQYTNAARALEGISR